MTPPSLLKNHIHVPWYNSSEWRKVYTQIFDIKSTDESRKAALNTLNVWKLRMPRLYAGIEGTLIVLKALLEVSDRLAEDTYKQLLASALMRFLNICLSTPSKNQETFFHIARTKKVPDWIVKIRHDFTHSQILPSIEMVTRALEYSLKWLKTNYWDQQSALIQDYEQCSVNEEDLVTLIGLYETVASAEENHYCVTTKLKNKLKKFNIRLDKSKLVILHRIIDVLVTNSSFNILTIPDIIARSGAIFNFTEISEDNAIPKEVIESWLPLIEMLGHYNMLFQLLREFVKICSKNEKEDKSRTSAAWLKAICKRGIEVDSGIISSDPKFKDASKEFALWTIREKNKYTSIYLREVLLLANYNDKFITYSCQAIEALTPTPTSKVPTEIYTINNIKNIFGRDLLDKIENDSETETVRWEVVKDSTIFNGIPVGKKLTSEFNL